MQLKGMIIMIYILFYSFSSVYAENPTSIFNNKEGVYSGSGSNVVVGVLEDDKEEVVNWEESPSQNRVIRPLFEKKGEDWVISTNHPDKMQWTIAYNGENAGPIESRPRSTGQNTMQNRPLVVVSEANASDPDKWQPFQPNE